MTRALLAVAPLIALLAASSARAQLARELGPPSGTPREAEAPEPEPSPDPDASLARRLDPPTGRAPEPAPAGPRERPWPGPQIQLGYSFYRVSDGYGGGDVHAGGVGIFLQLPLPELRIGVLGEAGSRGYTLGGDDLIVRGAVEIGVQLVGLLDPFVPHAVALASFGAIVGERFETTVAHGFGGGGLGLGGELRLYRNLHVGFQVSYQRLEMDGAAYDVFQLRLFAGL